MDFEIILTEIHEGPCHIVFDPPLCIKVFSGCEDEDDYVLVEYDFGMSVHFPICKKNNFCMSEGDLLEDIVRKTAVFDLFHAFFHTDIDPNYMPYHWALYGNLKERVTLSEDEDEF